MNSGTCLGKQFDSICVEKTRLEIKAGWNSPEKIWKRKRKKNWFKPSNGG